MNWWTLLILGVATIAGAVIRTLYLRAGEKLDAVLRDIGEDEPWD